MSKSYVTQFTEYVSEQQDSLRNKLKAKGLSPSPNATLGSLVGDLDNLQESFKADAYERDPNFPDIDTMFDNDPLRFINGGQYKACSYFIMQVDANGIVGFKFGSETSTLSYYGEKVIISDGTEFEGLTSASWTHTVGDNGIFIGEDGFKYCLLKIYKTEPTINTSTSSFVYSYGVVETIDDFFLGVVRIGPASPVSGYNGSSSSVLYYRWAGSNTTPTNITSMVFSGTSYVDFSLKCIRLDNYYHIANIQQAPSLQKFIANGENLNTGFIIGSSGYLSPKCLDFVKLPNGTPTSATVVVPTKEIFIPDNYQTFRTSYTTSGNNQINSANYLEKLHLGSGLTSWDTTGGAYYYNLKEITTSENIYANNTSAITISLVRSNQLTKQAILNLFNGIADRTGMAANIISLPPRVKAYLTSEELAIATNKNWTIS